jgi:hypothetical protein
MPRYFENALLLLTGRTRIPLPSLSKSSLSPLRTPNTRRISRGTVICPLLVIVACFCIVSLHIPYFTTNALLWLGSTRTAAFSQTRQLPTRRYSELSIVASGTQFAHRIRNKCCFDLRMADQPPGIAISGRPYSRGGQIHFSITEIFISARRLSRNSRNLTRKRNEQIRAMNQPLPSGFVLDHNQ